MDYTDDELEDLARMRELRLRLRTCADRRVEDCEAMPRATSWLEMYRQVRAIEAADRMVVRLYTPPARRRATRSDRKPAALSPARPKPEPVHFAPEESLASVAEVEDTPVAPEPSTNDLSADDIIAMANAQVVDAVGRVTRNCAEWACFWPDGARFDDKETDWRHHALTQDLALPMDDSVEPEAWLRGEILSRCNGIARVAGRAIGYRFDHRPYAESDPEFFTLSANEGADVEQPAAGEIPGPPGVPWWIVRNKRVKSS